MLSASALVSLSKDDMENLVRIFGDAINAQEKADGNKHSGRNSGTSEEENKARVIHSGPRHDLIDTLKSSSSSPTQIHKDADASCCSCFWIKCCPCSVKNPLKRTSSEEIAVKELTKEHCRNHGEFMELMELTTRNANAGLTVMNELKKLLELQMDPIAEARGLSSIGGSMWLLTFAIQHLIDPKQEYKGLMPQIYQIRATFQDIGQLSQVFAANTEVLFTKLDSFRENCIAIVEKMREVYRIKQDPFEVRPIMIRFKSFVEHRVRQSTAQKDPDDKEATFQVQWTPLNVMFKDAEADSQWEGFAALHLEDRVEIIKLFFETILQLLKKSMDLFDKAADCTYNLVIPQLSKNSKTSSLVEVTGAMVEFLKKGHAPELSPADLLACSTSLTEMWCSVDKLFEASVEVSLLIQESRDIVRVCYLYAIQFYKWKLADFNEFDPESQTFSNRKKLAKSRKVLARMMGHRRFSDAEMFLALADYTASGYQEVAKNSEIQSNGMFMKLDDHDEEPEESWGLVGELDELINPGRDSMDHISKMLVKPRRRTHVSVKKFSGHSNIVTETTGGRKSSDDDEDPQPGSGGNSGSPVGNE